MVQLHANVTTAKTEDRTSLEIPFLGYVNP